MGAIIAVDLFMVTNLVQIGLIWPKETSFIPSVPAGGKILDLW